MSNKHTPTSWFAAVVANPSISRDALTGRQTLNWDADAPDHCVVHRVALVDLLVEMDGLHAEIERLRAENEQFRSHFREVDEIVAEWEDHTPDNPPPGWTEDPRA